MRIVKAGKTYENAWVTDLHLRVQLVRRWKIENASNQGYHLERPRRPAPVRGVLHPQPIAFFIHQIELVDGLYQRVRTFFSSRRAFWDEVRSAFRLFLFTSWDQVLARMNSPPQPLPP